MAISYAYNIYIPFNGPAISKFTSPAKTIMFAEMRKDVAQPQNGGRATGDVGSTGYYTGMTTGNCAYGMLNANGYTVPALNTGQLAGLAENPSCNAYSRGSGVLGLHTDGANYLLADGHVKWLKPSLVCPYGSAPTSASAPNFAGNTGAGTEFAGNGTYPNFAATFSIK